LKGSENIGYDSLTEGYINSYATYRYYDSSRSMGK